MRTVVGLMSAVLSALALVTMPVSGRAAEGSVGVDVYSAYVWRGITFNDGLVVQPSFDLSAPWGFSVNTWVNYDIDDYDGALSENEISELDVTLTYALPIEAVNLSVGYIQYTFPQLEGPDASDTAEIFVSAGYELMDGLSVSLDVYYDVDVVEDIYAAVGIAYAMDVMEGLGLEISASAGYAGDEWCADGKAGLFDYSVAASASYGVTEGVSVGASATHVGSFDEDKLDTDVTSYFGMNAAYSF
ncbi:MAG: MltA-interacting MipA family protein [Lentisphaerae bacterium]|nr:MltA-interacting MipA family protein [Lentisphaerota bacterium]